MDLATFCPSCATRNLEGADECSNCGMDLRNIDLPRPASELEQSVMHLPLTALDLTVIHALSPDDTLETAVFTLMRQKVDMIEVVEKEQLIGVLSVRDVMTRGGADYREKLGRPLREFMTPRPETLPPDAPITFAINKMSVGGYRHVPVVQGGRMVGVASSRDVINYILKHSRDEIALEGATVSHGVVTA